MPLQIKRICEPVQSSDGIRILVDRLWPRGMSKGRAMLTAWEKDVAPSSELRKWFGHRPERFEEFSARYKAELDANLHAQKILHDILEKSQADMVTLLYGAKDPHVNHAIILMGYIKKLSISL